jgi:hypothetical protein
MAICLLGRELLQRTPDAVCMIDDKDVKRAEDDGCVLNELARGLRIRQAGRDAVYPDAERLKLGVSSSATTASRSSAPARPRRMSKGVHDCTKRSAPSSASRRATAKPMPLRRPTPVTTAARPVKGRTGESEAPCMEAVILLPGSRA